jgi:IS5 family transposase
VVREVVRHSEGVLAVIKKTTCVDFSGLLELNRAQGELETYIPLAIKVIDQAYRRIVKKEEVPAAEKIVSIFEVHSDIIVKGFRDVVFGHKIRVATGKSCMILSVEVLDGNPKDSELVESILGDHQESFNAAPEQAAFDGCFASNANRDLLKEAGVKELTFSKNLSMKLESLVSSKRAHKMLLRFRAGVEGSISFLKRVFSFDRVLDRSLKTFKAALQLGAAACNLTVLARYNIARANI